MIAPDVNSGTPAVSAVSRFSSSDVSLTVLLLCLCLNIFVVQPMGLTALGGRIFVTLLFSAILLSGFWTVAYNGVMPVTLGGVVLVVVALRWLRLWLRSTSMHGWDVLLSCVLCLTLATVVLLQVFREGPITAHRIQGAVAVYLLIGLAFSFAYEFAAMESPYAFNFPPEANPGQDLTPRFLYFSLVTLTTVGFGDITAMHPVTRSLVTLEALIGQLFPAILLARLVSMELFHQQTRTAERR